VHRCRFDYVKSDNLPTVKKKPVVFSTFEESEEEMLRQGANRTVAERIEHLFELMHLTRLLRPKNPSLKDQGTAFIELHRWKEGRT